MPPRGARPRPVTTGIAAPGDPADAFAGFARRPFPFLLESQSTGRFTYLGSDPYRVLLAKEGTVTEWRDGRETVRPADPLEVLREALGEHAVGRPDPDAPFPGGAVGYLGYDLGGRIERLPRQAADDRGFPDLFLAFYDRVTRIDRSDRSACVVELAVRPERRAIRPRDYRERFGAPPPRRPRPPTGVLSNFTRRGYLAAVRRAKEHIAAGDIYQVNLSQRFSVRTGLAPAMIYRRLRQASPAPYGALIQLGSRSVISSSPELFLERRGRRVVTRPIKGTRPRGAGPVEDERLRAELMASPKDDAELTMIVDLERNDLGRVCEYGTVMTPARKELERHPTVHHLVATVEGTLRRGCDAVDLLRAAFPSGSVTGAPKIRAMEIIDELEPTRRAAYTGALGYLGFDGDLALSIGIRIIETHGAEAWFQAGGGVVADSDPAAEYEETLAKAAGMARALGVCLP